MYYHVEIKMKQLIIQLLKSLSITLLVSLLFAGGIMLLTQTWLGFFSGLIFGIIVQLVGFYLWNNYLITKREIAQIQYESTVVANTAKQRTILKCAHCRVDNLVDILLDRGNEFTCRTCGGKNVVMIEFSTASKTEIMELQPEELFAPIEKELNKSIEFRG